MKDCRPTTHFKMLYNTDTQKCSCSYVKRQINYNKEKINTLNTETHNVCNELTILSQFNYYKL